MIRSYNLFLIRHGYEIGVKIAQVAGLKNQNIHFLPALKFNLVIPVLGGRVVKGVGHLDHV